MDKACFSNNSSFIQLLTIMKHVFSVTRSLSDMLQSKNLDLAKACTLVNTTMQQLYKLRSEEVYKRMEHFVTKIMYHFHQEVD